MRRLQEAREADAVSRQQVEGYERKRKRIDLTLSDLSHEKLRALARRMTDENGNPLSRSRIVERGLDLLWEARGGDG